MTLFSTEYISKLLKAEIEGIKDKANLHEIGPEFDAVVTDILHSDTVASVLLAMPMVVGMQGGPSTIMRAVGTLAAETGGDLTGRMGEVVKEHISMFALPLSFFYFGLKIGKDLAQKESEMQAEVAAPVDVNDKYATFTDRILTLINEYQQHGFATMAMDLQAAVDDLKK